MSDASELYDELDHRAIVYHWGTSGSATQCWHVDRATPIFEAWLLVHDQTRDAALVELQAENERLKALLRKVPTLVEWCHEAETGVLTLKELAEFTTLWKEFESEVKADG